MRDGPFQTGCSRATVLCLSLFGGGDLPSRTEGMKTCAGSRRLLLRREKWGRVLRTVHPLELGWSMIPSPSAHPFRSPRSPATDIVEGDTIPGCTPRTLSFYIPLSPSVEVRALRTPLSRLYPPASILPSLRHPSGCLALLYVCTCYLVLSLPL